jgi:hypothetical protein
MEFDSNKLRVKDSFIETAFDNYWTATGTSQLAINGVQLIFSGVLLKWGRGTITASTNTTINFLSAFKTAPYSITATNLTTGTVVAIGTGDFSTTNFKAYLNASGTATFSWFAIGEAV